MLEFHVAGDKIMPHPDDPAYQKRLAETLDSTPGVVWHGSLSREATMAMLAEGGVALNLWDYRYGPRMNDLVVSTKLLDYAAVGIPIVLTRTSAQEDILGRDYPLFVDEVDEALPVLRRVLADPAVYRAAAERTYAASRRFTTEAIHELIAPALAEARARSNDQPAEAPS
jgi:glycosyltransferase involved in cell wall biosynthesis